MSDQSTYPRGTVEYLQATVTADVDLTTQPVTIAVGNIDPSTGSWLAASWSGASWTSLDPETNQTLYHRVCKTDTPVAFTEGAFPDLATYYEVGVKIVDSPEIPVMSAGWVLVT